ncbi:MAG: ribose 5-phosphate isomerase B [Actinomycetota bacterium]|jgi:ribose 5-phosphate isomerase B|nr:ribose 5-phosphate isomerase B [Actinomycetota bacterium]
MRIAIGSDHAGFEQKQQLIAYLTHSGHELIDCGPASDDRCDYPDFAAKVAREVSVGAVDRGILICGTGIGMSMAANKVAGIRAANVISTEFAELAREHNNANVLCLSGRFVDLLTNEEICDVFLATSFGEGRHAPRVAKIDALD